MRLVCGRPPGPATGWQARPVFESAAKHRGFLCGREECHSGAGSAGSPTALVARAGREARFRVVPSRDALVIGGLESANRRGDRPDRSPPHQPGVCRVSRRDRCHSARRRPDSSSPRLFVTSIAGPNESRILFQDRLSTRARSRVRLRFHEPGIRERTQVVRFESDLPNQLSHLRMYKNLFGDDPRLPSRLSYPAIPPAKIESSRACAAGRTRLLGERT